jgi:Flp pilus assembly protein TadD
VTALIKAIIDPGGLNLQYEPTASYTARETFEHRRANCLSFTLMMVAMLRHLDVDVRFNDVEVPLIWDIHDESTLIFYKHINSIADFPLDGRAVMDLHMDEYDLSYEQRLISDQAAIAQYYNNRAMELLQQRDLRAAFPFLARAISLEPRQSYLWNNLGSLYQRAGKLQAAKAAFEVALTERGSGAVVMSNAARLYAVLGDSKRAAELTRRVAAFRDANPYFRYVRAISAFKESDFETARDEVVAAIRLYKIEHRFHFLLGAIYEKLGLHEQAVKSVNTALSLTTDEKQLARYRNKMDRLFSAHL